MRSNNTIKDILAYEVLDSRGNPTVKTKLVLSDDAQGAAIVPSGASTGSKEALELRDKEERFGGKGVLKAISHIHELKAQLCGLRADQKSIDELLIKLDGTNNFSKIGANAALGISMSLARANANSLQIPLYRYFGGINASFLPRPMCNVINGGSHANNNIDIQEFMILPYGFTSFKRGLQAICETYACLKKELNAKGYSTALGDEGGFAPNLGSNEEALALLTFVIKKAGYEGAIKLAIDSAASEFCQDNKYSFDGDKISSSKLIDIYESLIAKYPIISIEDGLAEDDYAGWIELSSRLGDKIQLVGDDIFVTNKEILAKGIEQKIANSILIKPNQIGTLTQTMQTINLAKENNYSCVMSHRSGESEDAFIADLAVGLCVRQIKTGAPARSERCAKYNRLLEIELGV